MLNVEFIQYKPKESDNFKRNYSYRLGFKNLLHEKKIPLKNKISNKIKIQMNKVVKEYENNISIIGSYLNSTDDIIFFLRIDEDIKYCAIDQVFNWVLNLISNSFYICLKKFLNISALEKTIRFSSVVLKLLPQIGRFGSQLS